MHKHKRKGGQQLSRKEARKQAREGRKQRKAEYFSSAPPNKHNNHGKRQAEAEHADSPQRKKAKLETTRPPTSRTIPQPTKAKSHEDVAAQSNAKSKKTKTALEKLAERAEAPTASKWSLKPSVNAIPKTPQEEKEDAYIAYLERKLGWVKGGKRTAQYGKGEEEDGLDGKQVCHLLRCSFANLRF